MKIGKVQDSGAAPTSHYPGKYESLWETVESLPRNKALPVLCSSHREARALWAAYKMNKDRLRCRATKENTTVWFVTDQQEEAES